MNVYKRFNTVFITADMHIISIPDTTPAALFAVAAADDVMYEHVRTQQKGQSEEEKERASSSLSLRRRHKQTASFFER